MDFIAVHELTRRVRLVDRARPENDTRDACTRKFAGVTSVRNTDGLGIQAQAREYLRRNRGNGLSISMTQDSGTIFTCDPP